MKVILLKDVAKIGLKGSVVEVPTGYAQNKLIPNRMAAPATPANLKQAQKLQAETEAAAGAIVEKFTAAAEALKEKPLTIAAEANEQSHLFQAIHEKDIAQAAKEAGVQLDVSFIKIVEPIKSLGTHTVSLVHKDHQAELVVEIAKK